MLTPYPHYLYVLISTPSTTDERGHKHPGETKWIYWGKCREETNGKGQEIIISGTRTYKFASLVQCPVGTVRIKEGQTVMVANELVDTAASSESAIAGLKDSGVARIIAECAKFDPGRLHCRLWL